MTVVARKQLVYERVILIGHGRRFDMGYFIESQYTLEVVRQPRLYDHLTQRFICTGFLLAGAEDRFALSTLLNGWEEISAYTADRIRFLFFKDVVKHVSEYDRYHSAYPTHDDLKQLAARTGFSLTTRRDIGVKRLAEDLGLLGTLPCLVWIRDDDPHTVLFKKVSRKSSSESFRPFASFATIYTSKIRKPSKR